MSVSNRGCRRRRICRLGGFDFARGRRLLTVSPVRGDYRPCQAETPPIVLFRFPGPALSMLVMLIFDVRAEAEEVRWNVLFCLLAIEKRIGIISVQYKRHEKFGRVTYV